MGFKSLAEMIEKAKEHNDNLFEAVLDDDINERDVSRESSLEKMQYMWEHMKASYDHYDANLKSASDLVGGDSAKVKEYGKGKTLCGEYINYVMYTSIAVAEGNACMKCIVASPTAGSCGVLPGVLIPYAQMNDVSDEKICEALYVAAGIGTVIAHKASISGAEGGCQAEIGSASGMAAAALAYLMGQNSEMIMNACALAIKNMLGLACDPVAGLVEVPCVKRNSAGAVNAAMCADLSMAGVRSAIPPDEVLEAMAEIGSLMPSSIKETSKAGLAMTETGKKVAACQRTF